MEPEAAVEGPGPDEEADEDADWEEAAAAAATTAAIMGERGGGKPPEPCEDPDEANCCCWKISFWACSGVSEFK